MKRDEKLILLILLELRDEKENPKITQKYDAEIIKRHKVLIWKSELASGLDDRDSSDEYNVKLTALKMKGYDYIKANI